MVIRHAISAVIREQRGMTLPELMAAVAVFAILMAISGGTLSHYFAGRSVDTAASEVKTQIREAQALAVATGQTYRIDFSDPSHRSYQLQKSQGGIWSNVRSAKTLPAGVEFDPAISTAFGGDFYLDFFARGTAEEGHHQLVLQGRFSKSKALQLDGETVNVY